MAHYHYGCDEWCEDCLPVSTESAEVDYDDGEQDSPANCCACGKPLDYSLTPDGVEYVIDSCLEAMDDWDDHIIPMADTAESEMRYYHGSPHFAIVEDWAKDLSNYSLDRKDRFILDAFLAKCAEWRKEHPAV